MTERNTTMKLGEPNKIAFESDSTAMMDFDEARKNRSDEFWEVLIDGFGIVSAKDNQPFDKSKHCSVCYETVRNAIKEAAIDPLNRFATAIAGKKIFDLPCGKANLFFWRNIKFIIAFNTSFEYYPESEDDGELGTTDWTETDYLDEETAFRYDVIKACDKLALEGAAFSMRIGSDTYRLWSDAMIKLGDTDISVQYKAVDDIVAALARTWADLRTWIYKNRASNSKKTRLRSKKAKK